MGKNFVSNDNATSLMTAIAGKVNELNGNTGIAEGESFALPYTYDGNALATHIYGMSIQDGTPDPSNPVDIVSSKADFRCAGKNLIPYPYYSSGDTYVTINPDGSLTYTGNNTTDIWFRFNDFILPAGTYAFSAKADNNSDLKVTYGVGSVDDQGNYTSIISVWPASQDTKTFTLQEDTHVRIRSYRGENIDFTTPVTGYVMLRLASVTDDTYEPYHSTDINTDLTLRAIEVSSTDDYNLEKDGRYYIADTIDWDEDNGYVLTRRVAYLPMTVTDTNMSGTTALITIDATLFRKASSGIKYGLCSCGTVRSDVVYWTLSNADTNLAEGELCSRGSGTSDNQFYFKTAVSTAEEVATLISGQYIASILATPTTETLTSEQAQSLLSMRTYDTATMITNTSDVPTEVVLEYGQSTTGTNALTGHNQAYIDQELEGLYGVKNLIPYPYSRGTQTDNGVTYVPQDNGFIIANNTASDTSFYRLNGFVAGVTPIILKAGQYILSGCPNGGGINTYRVFVHNSDSSMTAVDDGNGVLITLNADTEIGIAIRVAKNYVCNNLTFKPMLRLASIQSDEYQLYAMTNRQLTDSISNKVDKEVGKGLSTNDFTDTLKTKLDGIATGAEVNVQADWNQTTTTADDYIKNKPTIDSALSTTSTNAVQNKVVTTAINGKVGENPTFTEASTRANIASGETFATILGKIKKFFTDLKTVAFTGSYNDLSNKPTIPTVNNATLTIQRNGTTVNTFTANASSNVTADIAVPNGAVYYGTCNSQAANQKKAVTVAAAQNFSLATGAVLYVKFDADNTYSATAEAPVQLNVNSGTDVTVYGANTAAVTGTNTTYFGRKNYINCYMYDGTYWVWQGSSADNNSDTKVTQTVTTTNANYEVLFSQTADNTTRTEAARKNNNLLFNPSTGNLQATQLNGVAIGSSPKFTDTWTAMVGATSSANGSVGYVNAVPPKDGYNTKYLRADGTWTVPPDNNTWTAMVGATSSANGSVGYVNAVPPKDGYNTKYLRADGSWQIPPEHRSTFYGTCATAAGTKDKVVTLADTTGWELRKGVIVGVKYTYTNSYNATASNKITLNVNNTGALNIYGANAAAPTGTNWVYYGGANRIHYYMYDGTYWVFMSHSADLNDDNYRLRYADSLKAETAITAAKVCVGTSAGYKMVESGTTFDISYPVLYSGTAINAGATGNQFWLAANNITISNIKTGLVGVPYSTLYLVGSAFNGSTFTIDSEIFTFTPNVSGKFYIPIGIGLTDTSKLDYCYIPSVLKYDGTNLIKITGDALTVNGHTVNKDVPNNAVFTDTKKVFFGTCTGQAANQKKAVTIPSDQNFTLTTGAIIFVKFDANNTYSATAEAPVQLNVNSSGDKTIYGVGGSAITGTNTTFFGRTNYINQYVYDGTYWVWTGSSADNNTTYSPQSLGIGYGTCTTAAATAAKAATLSGYSLITNGTVAIKFTNAVPANATLAINGKTAKNIYYRGAAIAAGVINAGDTATFFYNGSQYHLVSIDRPITTSVTSGSTSLVTSGAVYSYIDTMITQALTGSY